MIKVTSMEQAIWLTQIINQQPKNSKKKSDADFQKMLDEEMERLNGNDREKESIYS